MTKTEKIITATFFLLASLSAGAAVKNAIDERKAAMAVYEQCMSDATGPYSFVAPLDAIYGCEKKAGLR